MVSVGGVNLVQALIEAERRILVLEKIVETILNSRTGPKYNVDLNAITEQAVKDLQSKYPDLGIQTTPKA